MMPAAASSRPSRCRVHPLPQHDPGQQHGDAGVQGRQHGRDAEQAGPRGQDVAEVGRGVEHAGADRGGEHPGARRARSRALTGASGQAGRPGRRAGAGAAPPWRWCARKPAWPGNAPAATGHVRRGRRPGRPRHPRSDRWPRRTPPRPAPPRPRRLPVPARPQPACGAAPPASAWPRGGHGPSPS